MTGASGGNGAGRRLRIAYLLQQFPLATETFAVSDIAALLAEGHEVTVYTLKPPRKDEQRLAERFGVPSQLKIDRPSLAALGSWPKQIWSRRAGVAQLVRQVMPRLRTAPGAAIQALLCIPRLVEIANQVRMDGSDVVHAFWSRHVGLVLPILKAEGAPALRTAFLGAYDLVADDFIADMTVSASNILFSHAKVNRPILERKASPGTQIEIIHRGIPLMPLSQEERDPFRIITASALVRSKNVEAVIRSFADARAKDGRLTLSIYGEGPDRQRLEQLALQLGCGDQVRFEGHVARDALFVQMQRAALFLLLTKKASERLPNVLKEALWAGCAVIASPSEGIEELLPDPTLGLIVDPDDTGTLAAALHQRLSEDSSQAADRRQRARAFISENFSSASSMAAYVQAWKSRLSSPDLSAWGARAEARREPAKVSPTPSPNRA